MNQEINNQNLENPAAESSAQRSNMPDNQVPRFRSNSHSESNKVKSDAGFLSREVGEGDFGAEEARADAEKGNPGAAGNMPNTVAKKLYQDINQFPEDLKKQYPEIISSYWNTGETLEIHIHEDVKSHNFANKLREELGANLGFDC